jgi:outer membrane immunogenic protein
MIFRSLAGGAAFAAATAASLGAAAAADLPLVKVPPVAPVAYAPAAIYSWTGIYIGGQVGAGFGRSSWSDPFSGANNAFDSGAGVLGGGQVGANYQLNRLVLGVEGDFSWTGLRGSGADLIGDTIATNTHWTSTVTGRVGAAFDRLLIYGKGGVAFARDQSSFIDLAGNGGSNAFTRTGWTAGVGRSQLRLAGVEFHHADDTVVRVERQPQRSGDQGGFELPLRRTVTN